MKKICSTLLLFAVIALGACNDDDNNNPVVDEIVKAYISENYPGAVIKDTDYDKGFLEVEIYHDARIKDVFFNSLDEWVATSWDVSTADLPVAVTAKIAELYSNYRIDDADYVVTPSGESYYIEVERGNIERAFYIAADGTIVSE